jgi:hypothetical protein
MPCITLTKVMLPQSASKGKPFGNPTTLGFYTTLLAMFDHAVEERRPVRVEKWLSRETR